MSRGPGLRQRQILEVIEEIGVASLLQLLPKPYTDSDYAALHRAAHLLARGGKIELGRVACAGHIARGKLLLVCMRPGEHARLRAQGISVELVTNGTKSTLKGASLRSIAKALGISPSTVRRDRRTDQGTGVNVESDSNAQSQHLALNHDA